MGAVDWSVVNVIVERIPKGRWASYGDVAVAAGHPRNYAQPLGHYLADADLDGAWRVLDKNGRPYPRFRLGEGKASGDIDEVIEWLKQEKVRFDDRGRAQNHCRLEVFQLKKLEAGERR